VAVEEPETGAKAEELAEVIQAIRDRVRSRYPNGSSAGNPKPLPDLVPVLHARDAAAAKVAAIGTVNPRPPGAVNAIVQWVKQVVSRVLDWHVRDQVVFNRGVISCVDALLEALNESNRALAAITAEASERDRELENLRSQIRALEARDNEMSVWRDAVGQGISAAQAEARSAAGTALTAREEAAAVRGEAAAVREEAMAVREEAMAARAEASSALAEAAAMKDARSQWAQWRIEWEHKLAVNEVQFLRSVADLQSSFQHRALLSEGGFRETAATQHKDFTLALEKAAVDIQKQLWKDLENVRLEFEKLIHNELRVLRQRALAGAFSSPASTAAGTGASQPQPGPGIDYLRFADRFRGTEEYVKDSFRPYLADLAGCEEVLDIGCGRGEFLELLREAGTPARGIDLCPELVSICREKGLAADAADLFEYLESVPQRSLGGIFCAQVVEHLDPIRLPEFVRLSASRLRRGGVLIVETPNPECLAVFSSHFYLDPTHVRPVPPVLMNFYMEEAGFGGIEIRRRSLAGDFLPGLKELPESFRNNFFGGLDYAILGRKLD
jgi:SAM-dependent methyltransferase